jgi:hypothetical protein
MTPCAKCGQPHVTATGTPACTGHVLKDGNRPCRKAPIDGLNVCRSHGGAAPRAKAAAARNVVEQKAAAVVATLGLPVDISPTEALLEEVRWTAGHVQWLRQQVGELERGALVWGTTRTETEVGGSLDIDLDDTGDVTGVGSAPSNKIVQASAPSIWYELYAKERAHLVAVCSAALKAGVEERRVRLAEKQGDIVIELIRRILDALYRALLAAGLTDDHLRDAWTAAVANVVPREIRAIRDAGGA